MVYRGKPRLAVLPGGQAGEGVQKDAGMGMEGVARREHLRSGADCMIEIFTRIEEMAARTASPRVFRARINRHFSAPTAKDEHERMRQANGLLKRLERFEQEFNYYMRDNHYDILPAEKIVAVVEQMVDLMGRCSIPGGWRPPPPESA